MKNGFFALISRMRLIRRWGLMRNSYDENVQEHSHMTAVLAHALAVIRRDVFGGTADPERAAVAALFHDACEIVTGDLPTPVKYFSGEMSGAYKVIERDAEEKLLDMLPGQLQPAYRSVFRDTDEETNKIVKAADKLCAYIKCVEELRAGNTEFRSAEEQIRTALAGSPLPELRYFMENFMPAFGTTLDELTTIHGGERR